MTALDFMPHSTPGFGMESLLYVLNLGFTHHVLTSTGAHSSKFALSLKRNFGLARIFLKPETLGDKLSAFYLMRWP